MNSPRSAVQLEGVTVLADNVQVLGRFLRDGLGLPLAVEEEHYLAVDGGGVRLAVFARTGMGANTHDHPDYIVARRGQAFELNFECATSSEVDAQLVHITAHGGSIVAEPVETSWGHYTAFFADPEGNIHSLFADLS